MNLSSTLTFIGGCLHAASAYFEGYRVCFDNEIRQNPTARNWTILKTGSHVGLAAYLGARAFDQIDSSWPSTFGLIGLVIGTVICSEFRENALKERNIQVQVVQTPEKALPKPPAHLPNLRAIGRSRA